MSIKKSRFDRVENKLETILNGLVKKPFLLAACGFVFMLCLMICLTPFSDPVMSDAFYYILKAFEIHNGNYALYRTDFIGWPLFIAFFLKIFGTTSLLKGMFLARLLTVLLIAVTIFPFTALAKKMLNPRAFVIAILAYSFSAVITGMGSEALTEPLFILVLIVCVYFLSEAGNKPRYIVIATVLAGISYYIRANGLFLPAILMIYTFFLCNRKKVSYHYLWIIPVVFFAVSAPQMYARYADFGSPFDYGENSKYFVDSYSQVWVGNAPAPTLSEYLASHTVNDYFDKFINHGLFDVVAALFNVLGGGWFLLFLTGLVYFLFLNKNSALEIFFILIAVYLAGLIPVFHIFGHPRHLYALVPFCIIIAALFFTEAVGALKGKNILTLSFILFLVFSSPVFSALAKLIAGNVSVSFPQIRDQWAIWTGDSLKGNIALIGNQELIRTYLIEKKQASSKDQVEFAKQTGVYLTGAIGNYAGINDAFTDFKNRNINYLLVNRGSFPVFLREIYSPEWSTHFVLLKSFKSKPGDRWMVPEMDIFRLDY